MVTVAWSKLYKPENEGGLGIRSLRSINDAALLKLSWDMLTSKSDWASLLKARFLKNNKPIVYYAKSTIWSSVRNHISSVIDNSSWCNGNGKSINFWHDNWLSNPVSELLDLPMSVHPFVKATISYFISNGTWRISNSFFVSYPDIENLMLQVDIPTKSYEDTRV